jgi:hypothetical protein
MKKASLVLLVTLAACGDGSSAGSSDPGTPAAPPGPPPTLVKALDISVWSGTLSSANVQGWIAQGYTHLIVGTQNGSTAQQQLTTAVAGGMTVDIYKYLYFDTDMTTQVQNALAIANGYPIGRIWLDVEDDPGTLSVGQIVAKVQEAVDACGATPRGIYTGAWWWNANLPGCAAFSDLPLWYSWYDGIDSLDTWSTQAFGGWSRPTGKQYQGNVAVSGINTDTNVLWLNVADSGPALPPGVPAAPTGLSGDGGTVTASSTTLTWSDVGGTSHQLLMQVGSPGAWNYYWTWTMTPESFTVWPQSAGQNYRWRVRAKNGTGWGAWSAWATFYFP